MEELKVEDIVSLVVLPLVTEKDKVVKSKPNEKVYHLSEEDLRTLFDLAGKLSRKRPRAKREWTEEEKEENKRAMDILREKRKYRIRERELE
jgi:hypothetical protein